MPLTGTPEPERIARVAAYALVLACVVSLLHGFLLATRGYATPRVLALGAAAAGSGFLFAALVRPENLEDGSGLLTSFGLFLADLCRILAAASVGVALARHVSSAGVILLVAAVATASDLFSVYAGPTRTLVEEDSPVLDLLVLVFPTFGSAPGFGLGASDVVFLALFAAASRFLNLRYSGTLLSVCSATLLAMIAGLLLERPLPALPFVAGACVLVNADLILASLTRKLRSST